MLKREYTSDNEFSDASEISEEVTFIDSYNRNEQELEEGGERESLANDVEERVTEVNVDEIIERYIPSFEKNTPHNAKNMNAYNSLKRHIIVWYPALALFLVSLFALTMGRVSILTAETAEQYARSTSSFVDGLLNGRRDTIDFPDVVETPPKLNITPLTSTETYNCPKIEIPICQGTKELKADLSSAKLEIDFLKRKLQETEDKFKVDTSNLELGYNARVELKNQEIAYREIRADNSVKIMFTVTLIVVMSAVFALYKNIEVLCGKLCSVGYSVAMLVLCLTMLDKFKRFIESTDLISLWFVGFNKLAKSLDYWGLGTVMIVLLFLFTLGLFINIFFMGYLMMFYDLRFGLIWLKLI